MVEVLASVQLDDQAFAGGTKINDVLPDGMLPAEVDAIHPVGSQVCPQAGFCWAWVMAHGGRQFDDSGGSTLMH